MSQLTTFYKINAYKVAFCLIMELPIARGIQVVNHKNNIFIGN